MIEKYLTMQQMPFFFTSDIGLKVWAKRGKCQNYIVGPICEQG